VTVTAINRPPTGPTPTPAPRRRSPGRRPTRQIAELAALPTDADRIRYACKNMLGQPTTESVRAWLADREISVERPHASRVVNKWLRAQDLPPTPSAGIAIIDTQPVPQPVTEEAEPAEPADTEPSTDPAPVTAPVVAPVAAPVTPPAPPVPAPPAAAAVITAPVTAPVTQPVTQPPPSEPSPELVRRSKRLRKASYPVLALVALAGAALSYQSLETAAEKVFPTVLAHMFPLLVDALIVGASLAYLAGATVGRGRPGWRLTAHAAVGGTLLLNGLAAGTTGAVPWHIAAPLVWSVIVEMVARDLLGDHRQTTPQPDSLPLALWLTAPAETASTWLRVRRQAAHASARLEVGTHAAAREALRMALPGLSGRRARKIIGRQLRAGSITPEAVLAQAVSIMGDLKPGTPKAVLRDVLAAAVRQPEGAAPTL
jgi:hypothetical protein